MIGGLSRLPLTALVVAVLAGNLLVACGSGSETGSDQFRDQTDSAILDFGEESDEAELDEAATAVEDFLTARAADDWPEACAQLSRAVLAKIEHLATTATGLADKSCPSFLGAFTELTDRERRDSAEVDAGSLRQRERRAFLIYHGADEVVYAMPMRREGEVWKVDSLSPKRLS